MRTAGEMVTFFSLLTKPRSFVADFREERVGAREHGHAFFSRRSSAEILMLHL